MKLLIISYTEHYRRNDGAIVGWGATVREINRLTEVFETIYHLAPLYEEEAPEESLPYEHDGIHFIPIPPAGGRSLVAKLGILRHAPIVVSKVRKSLGFVDVFQFRAPTGIGVYLLPWLTIFSKKPGWVKYAGNWNQENPPKGYAFQRWWLKRNFLKCPVTMNGKWPDQPSHCLTFENPCLDEDECDAGEKLLEAKDYNGLLNFCFVGRLDGAKGVDRILAGFKHLGPHPRIGVIHFVGDSPERTGYEAEAATLGSPVQFHGFLDRGRVNKIYAQCHVVLLLSKSEGFPKVVAEAANYGCIPIVSDVGSLGQHIQNGENGFCLEESECRPEGVAQALEKLFRLEDPKRLALGAHAMAASFTFARYNNRITHIVENNLALFN